VTLQILVLALLISRIDSAQAASLKMKVEGIRYPSLADQARIQGEVEFYVKEGKIDVVHGHPLLAPAAELNLRNLEPYLPTNVHAIYIFKLSPQPKVEIIRVPKGDRFERAILRLLHLDTEKAVMTYHCEPKQGDPSIYELDEKTGELRIRVFGGVHCLMDSTQKASR
jgi:hypothetical protein